MAKSLIRQRNTSRLSGVLESHPFLIGLSLRLILMVLLPLLLDDGVLLQGVKYTDIDYGVFTDAARYIARGESPFQRHTYRYTPFLALILSYGSNNADSNANQSLSWSWIGWWKSERYFGRLLFCLADALCGLVILKLRRKFRKGGQRQDDCMFPSLNLQDALWWLYNPLPINICTRGSAESFVVLLFVLATVSLSMVSLDITKSRLWGRAVLAGSIHGLAIHTKLYPVIYTVSFMAYFAKKEDELKMNEQKNLCYRNWSVEMEKINDENHSHPNKDETRLYPFPWLKPRRLTKLVKIWFFRLSSPSSLLFLFASLSTFGGFTFLAVSLYGSKALDEGLLYHFSRVDHRHNYSMFWYWIYLARSRLAKTGGDVAKSSLSTLGRSLLLPQIILLLYSSLGIAPFDLTFALFVQTFFFVAMNKVITAQYFTWYLVLLPLCSERINWRSRDMLASLTFLGISVVVWLGCAFCLEMKGMAIHAIVWMASLLFYVANVNTLRVILKNYKGYDIRPKVKSS